jgi:hypothetical protein
VAYVERLAYCLDTFLRGIAPTHSFSLATDLPVEDVQSIQHHRICHETTMGHQVKLLLFFAEQ